MSRIRERLTYANVVSSIALFCVLGGGAYAASALDKNEVKSKHIKTGAVKNADLADNAVTSPKVANGSLLGEDFAAGQLPAGQQGPQGERGPSGAANVTRRVSGLVTVQANGLQTGSASCNAGERATGGGFLFSTGYYDDFHVLDDGPLIPGNPTAVGTPTGWSVQVQNVDANNSNNETLDFRVYVVCVSP